MNPDRCAQRNATLLLKPFEAWAAQGGFSCSVRLRQKGCRLLLCFRVHGPLEQLIIPPASDGADFRPELWRTTCMECFLRPERGQPYTEWNFSPSRHWWVCAFDSYRLPARRQPDGLRPLRMHARTAAEHLDLVAFIPLNDDVTQRIDPAVLLEHADGRRSHWARTHQGDRPDFHRSPATAPCAVR